jgi:hypothetical protein
MARKNQNLVPQARGGLLAAEHSKRGRRFITVMDSVTQQVALLEAWEYAVLVLCDGERPDTEILELMRASEPDELIDTLSLRRCLKFFESKELIEPIGLLRTATTLDNPKTMAELQLAYEEWHKEPVATGQFPSGLAPWSADDPQMHPPSLEPTQTQIPWPQARPVQVGSTLELGSVDSLLLNPVVASVEMKQEPTDPSNSFKTNTQAKKILNAVYDTDGSLVDAYNKPRMNVLVAVDEAVSAIENPDASPVPEASASESSKGVRFSRLEEDATVQVRTVKARNSSDRAATNITGVGAPERVETIASAPERGMAFREWLVSTKRAFAALPLGDSLSLRLSVAGLQRQGLLQLNEHLTSLSGLLLNDDATTVVIEGIEAICQGRERSSMVLDDEDAASLLAEILRQAKSAGVCPICLRVQALRFLMCASCGFRPGGSGAQR